MSENHRAANSHRVDGGASEDWSRDVALATEVDRTVVEGETYVCQLDCSTSPMLSEVD